jgi:hypothetical protein
MKNLIPKIVAIAALVIISIFATGCGNEEFTSSLITDEFHKVTFLYQQPKDDSPKLYRLWLSNGGTGKYYIQEVHVDNILKLIDTSGVPVAKPPVDIQPISVEKQ